MKSTLTNLKREVERLGATIEQSNGRMLSFSVDAPAGKVWTACDGHTLTSSSFEGRGAMASIIHDIIDRMRYGLEDCVDHECEICHPVTK